MHRNELEGCGLKLRGGIAAVEDMRQAYIVKHIRKGLTLLSYCVTLTVSEGSDPLEMEEG